MTKPELDAAALDAFAARPDEGDVRPVIAQARLALSQAERIAELESELAETRANQAVPLADMRALQAHANALRNALESAPILTREPGEYGRPWLPTDHVGTTFEHWDGWYRKRNAALAQTPAQSLAAHDAAVLERAAKACEARKADCGAATGALSRGPDDHCCTCDKCERCYEDDECAAAIRALAAQAQEVKP